MKKREKLFRQRTMDRYENNLSSQSREETGDHDSGAVCLGLIPLIAAWRSAQCPYLGGVALSMSLKR